MSNPKVSIIILNWNGFEVTMECLDSLKKIKYPNYEIIVVDNASSGDDVKILKEKYGDFIQIIANDQNYGYPEGNNIGMRYAMEKGTDYLLLLNNDTVVDSEFATELVKVAESDPSIGMTGSKIYYYDRPNMMQATGGRIHWWLGVIEVCAQDENDVGQYDNVTERDYLFGTSLLIKKSLIEKISFLDPYYFFGVEEYDYCTRAKQAGFRIIYVPKSKIWHKVGADSAKFPKYPDLQAKIKRISGIGKYKFYYRLYKDHGPTYLFVLPFVLQMSLVGELLLRLWRGDWKKIRSGLVRRLGNLLSASNKPRSPR